MCNKIEFSILFSINLNRNMFDKEEIDNIEKCVTGKTFMRNHYEVGYIMENYYEVVYIMENYYEAVYIMENHY